MAEQRRRSADELADEWQRRADRTREAARAEQATEEHLNALLPDHGFYCLHDCRWPGTRAANIDHVVIGPTGVWVIDDKRLSHRVSRSKDGSLWSGRYPMRSQLTKAREQARAVADALGVDDVAAVLSLDAPSVPEPTFTVSGVHVARAMWPTACLVRDADPLLGGDDVRSLGDRAVAHLDPRSLAVPRAGAADVGTMKVPDLPPDFAMLPPAPRERVVARHTSPAQQRPTRRRTGVHRRRRSPIAEALTGIASIAVLFVVARALPGIVDDATSTPTTTSIRAASAVSHSCPASGAGWTATVTWSGTASAVRWGPALEGPWEPLVVVGDSASRGAIAPRQRGIFRIERTRPDGTTYEDAAVADAPNEAC